MSVPVIELNSGRAIPQLGFGVYKVEPGDTERVVTDALEVGYRHIDTASMYGNEVGVGAAIAASGIPRDEIFVTTKLLNADHGARSTIEGFERSLEALGLEHVDLYLIHWPCPERGLYVESWLSMEGLFADGRARSIGVSNFLPHHLRAVTDAATVVPAVNQIELHPYYQQREADSFGREQGIVTEAWSPLGRGSLVDDPGVEAIAGANGKTLAQVILRWHIQRGFVVIPKSVRRERMAENLDIFDFELTDAEVGIISALDRGGRLGSHPDEVT
ncbi:MAG: aldo/keto reductase [Microbacteriaceae bacterium]|jgi:2,5-diketo-D-gluconate reductase A|nr:aldo/keto reductase [Microbacteriaceae bacterium]